MFWCKKLKGFSICFGLKKWRIFCMFWYTKLKGLSICFGYRGFDQNMYKIPLFFLEQNI